MVVEINEVDCSIVKWSKDGKTDWKSANIDDLIHAYEQKRGKWIWMGDRGDSRFMCSVCLCKENVPTIMGKPEIWGYCPNCGAKMSNASNASNALETLEKGETE